MARVTGIGGVFFKSTADSAALAAWYRDHLGMPLEPFGGAILRWPNDTAEDKGLTVWHVAGKDSKWFSPSSSSFMIDYRVDDLAALVAQLKATGVAVLQGPSRTRTGSSHGSWTQRGTRSGSGSRWRGTRRTGAPDESHAAFVTPRNVTVRDARSIFSSRTGASQDTAKTHTHREELMKPAKNTICLWFDREAEDAAKFYAKTFPDSRVTAVHRAPGDYPSGKQGDVLTVEFTVLGIPCMGLNGGPMFKHSEAFSFQVATADQAETDRYWNAIIGNGGEPSACGWCRDKWGLSWQITPIALTAAITDPDPAAAKRSFEAMMTMGKIDIAAIEKARRG